MHDIRDAAIEAEKTCYLSIYLYHIPLLKEEIVF